MGSQFMYCYHRNCSELLLVFLTAKFIGVTYILEYGNCCAIQTGRHNGVAIENHNANMNEKVVNPWAAERDVLDN